MSADAEVVPVAFLKTWVDPVYGVAKRVDLDDRLDDWMPRPVQVAPLYSADTIAALKKDAERLDWLDKHPREATIRVGTDMKACVFYGVSCDPKWTMREAIDAAIDAAQSTEGER